MTKCCVLKKDSFWLTTEAEVSMRGFNTDKPKARCRRTFSFKSLGRSALKYKWASIKKILKDFGFILNFIVFGRITKAEGLCLLKQE